MKITLLTELGNGGYADVWRATDDLDRDVAVKIVRESAAVASSAVAHAKALARTSHPNIVSVIALERIVDPGSGSMADGIVMELIEGITLEERLRGRKLSADEARRIGVAVASAIAHIHERGMEHGDLHDGNVMINAETVKVIDILYTKSLAMLSTGSRRVRLRRDLVSLRLILQHVILHSALSSAGLAKFDDIVGDDPSVLDLREAFVKVTDSEGCSETARQLGRAYARFTDEAFVDGREYAALLMDETPPGVIASLLIKIVNSRSYNDHHQAYFRALYERLSAEEQSAFLSHLGVALEREIPKGRWWPLLKMFSSLGRDGWNALTPNFRKRLESLLVKDVALGRLNSDGTSGHRREGNQGTYARSLWRYFSKPRALADTIVSMLNNSVNTQNYIGKHFLAILPELAEATNTKDQMIRAIKGAIGDGAKLVIDSASRLPDDWKARITPE